MDVLNRMDCYMSLRYILLCTVLTRYFTAVDSIFCYVCRSREMKTCGYQFMLNQQDTEQVTWCTTSCFKLSTKRGDREVISRGCLPDMKTIDWCRLDRKDDIKGVMCTCNDDYCNTSHRVRPFPTVFLVTLSVVIYYRIFGY